MLPAPNRDLPSVNKLNFFSNASDIIQTILENRTPTRHTNPMNLRNLKILPLWVVAFGACWAAGEETKPLAGGAGKPGVSATVLRSGMRRTPLLELYDSEGCSYCPPAEEKFSGLSQVRGLWKDFVPLAMHVEYWNNAQWSDRWSDKAFGDRQRRYAGLWGLNQVSTPGVVWDGRPWTGWMRLPQLPRHSSEPAGLLEVSTADGSHWRMRFRPAGSLPLKCVGNLALLGSGITSDVHAGENAGRKLCQDFVVLRLVAVPLTADNGSWSGETVLAIPAGHGAQRLAVAAWVEDENSPRALQSTGGWLQNARELLLR